MENADDLDAPGRWDVEHEVALESGYESEPQPIEALTDSEHGMSALRMVTESRAGLLDRAEKAERDVDIPLAGVLSAA